MQLHYLLREIRLYVHPIAYPNNPWQPQPRSVGA
jgi:hypothetical protein